MVAGVLHHVLFGCFIRSLPRICGKMQKVWCAQSTKEKEGSRATRPFSFQWDNTMRCRQSMRACGSMSDCLHSWTTSGWCQSRGGLAICTILLNGSCGVGQRSGPASHMSGTDPAGSPQLAMSCRGEPCWTKKHVSGQGQRFLLSNIWATWISCGRSWRPPPHSALLQAIPCVPDIQSAWLLLLH